MNAEIEVMKGKLTDYDLANVLQVVSIGRQYIGVELAKGERPHAKVFTKCGQVLSAQTGHQQGVVAFLRMFDSSYDTFRVFRLATPPTLPEPIGTLHELLARIPKRAPKEPSSNGSRPAAGEARELPAGPVAEKVVDEERSPTLRPGEGRAVVTSEGPIVAAPAPPPNVDTTTDRAVIAVSSSKGGVGKTTIALHLALSFARQGHRTIVVDADPNGDVLSYVNGRAKAVGGAYDVMLDGFDLEAAMLTTTVEKLRILPACGARLPDADLLGKDITTAWAALFERLLKSCDLVVVDTPAGTYGPTLPVLRAASHVVGVLQAEAIAHRSFGVFRASLEALPEEHRPQVLGVVLNMLQTRETSSLEVLRDACAGLDPSWLFDMSIPRNPLFLRASHEGVPLGFLDEHNPPAIAWLFDNLASEVTARLGVATPAASPKRLLL